MKIAILSNGNANYSTRRLVEEAEKRGHDVKVIKYKNCYISIAQHDNQVFYKGKPLGKFDAVIPRISSSMTRYGTAIVRQLEMQGDYVLSKSLAIVRARDKLRSMQLLAKNGIGVPKTVVSRNTTDIDELLEQLEPPVIIKLASGTHGNGVVLAETKKAAKSVMQAFYLTDDSGTNILLQEFIKESAGTDIRAFVVGSKVVASMQRKSLDDDFRSNLHKGGSGTIIPSQWFNSRRRKNCCSRRQGDGAYNCGCRYYAIKPWTARTRSKRFARIWHRTRNWPQCGGQNYRIR